MRLRMLALAAAWTAGPAQAQDETGAALVQRALSMM
jgi:hypothetical protein